MKVEFFVGDYYAGVGRPYVILSPTETNDEYSVERFILFQHNSGKTEINSSRITRPKLDMSIDDFIESEVRYTEEWIFYEIIFQQYQMIDAVSYGSFSVRLRPTKKTVLVDLLNKFNNEMNQVLDSTKNKTLKSFIENYKSLNIKRITE